MGLGSEKDFTLDEARNHARKARQQLYDGIDPIDTKQAARAAQAVEAAKRVIFKDAVQQYFDSQYL